MVLTTTGYGDINPLSDKEKVFTIVLFFVGTVIFALVIVHLQDIVAQLDVTSDIFKSRLDLLNAFLLRESLPEALLSRSTAHMEKLWALQRGATGAEIKSFLPPHLYSAAVREALDAHIKKLFFVGAASAEFQMSFLSKLEMHAYLEGDMVFRTGECENTLRLLFRGEVSLVRGDSPLAGKIVLQQKRSGKNSGDGEKGEEEEAADETDEVNSGHQLNRVGFLDAKDLVSEIRFLGFNRGGSGFGSGFGSGNGRRWDYRMRSSNSNSNSSFSMLSSPPKKHQHSHSTASARESRESSAKANASIANIIDGALGEYEFFSRTYYACGGRASTDCITFEIPMSVFWKLVSEHHLETEYAEQLREQFQALQKLSTLSAVRKLQMNLSTSKMVKMMSSHGVEEKQSWVLEPDSLPARLWNLLHLVVIAYIAFSAPYYCAFPAAITPAIAITDALVVIFSTIEIYASLRFFAIVEEGRVVSEPSEFAKLYCKRHLKYDTICSLPLSLVVFAASPRAFANLAFAVCRCLDLLRLRKAGRLSQAVVGSVEALIGYRFNPDAISVAKTCVLICYFGHITSCAFCGIGVSEYRRDGNSWISANGFLDKTYLDLYLEGLLWSMYTIVTVGYGCIAIVTDTERIFAICIMVAGAVLCNAGLSAVLSSIIANNDKQSGTVR